MQQANNTAVSESNQIFFLGKKVTKDQQMLLLKLMQEDPTCPSRKLIERARQSGMELRITLRHFNRLRANWGYSCLRGRPKGKKNIEYTDTGRELAKPETDLQFVGVHLFAEWMESQGGFAVVLLILRKAMEEWCADNPAETFPLLNHSDETLLLRFKALFYAPSLGIGKLTELDYKEHALATLIGKSYQTTTLVQYLGQIERINAGKMLVDILLPSESGRFCYIDGHMIAFWSTVPMHKGKITMLGRIMAGSQAVVAHGRIPKKGANYATILSSCKSSSY